MCSCVVTSYSLVAQQTDMKTNWGKGKRRGMKKKKEEEEEEEEKKKKKVS